MNSFDLKTIVKGHPLTLTLKCFHVLGQYNVWAKYDTAAFSSSQEIADSIFFPYKSIGKSIWPFHKKVIGQPNVCINLVDLESTMLYAKFQSSLSLGSGEEVLQRVFTIYMHGGHLCQRTITIWTNFHSPRPKRLNIKYGWPREEFVWWMATDDRAKCFTTLG